MRAAEHATTRTPINARLLRQVPEDSESHGGRNIQRSIRDRCDQIHPPARFALKPRRVNSATIVSRWSPWISIRSPFTVPPLPQRFFNSVARLSISADAKPRPVMTVTPLPLRPCVSRATRTGPATALPGVPCLHTHSGIGRWQLGQRRPTSVEYTRRESLLDAGVRLVIGRSQVSTHAYGQRAA
jgi:hypothetical protein